MKNRISFYRQIQSKHETPRASASESSDKYVVTRNEGVVRLIPVFTIGMRSRDARASFACAGLTGLVTITEYIATLRWRSYSNVVATLSRATGFQSDIVV